MSGPPREPSWAIRFREDHGGDADILEFRSYDFAPASVCGTPRVMAGSINDFDRTTFPPSIRVGRELLFLPHPQDPGLATFVERNKIPEASRADVWALLLEPFLDTEFSPDEQARTRRLLAAAGIPPSEIEEIRGRVGDAMLRYNSLLWEWIHLGLYDLLTAMRPGPLGAGSYEALYWWAMEIALRPDGRGERKA